MRGVLRMVYKMIEYLPDILLVSDDSLSTECVFAAISSFSSGCSAKVVDNGVEAIAFLLLNHLYDTQTSRTNLKLILLDANIPRINGLEVLQVIKGHPRTQYLPVVLITDSFSGETVHKAYRQGANACVERPDNYDEFFQVILKVLEYWLNV